MKTGQTRKAKAIYLELALAGESATATGILPETQRQAEEWESFRVGKKEALGVP